MAKKKQVMPKSGKKQAARGVPEANPDDIFDDPGPTRALPAVDGDDEPEEVAEGDVHDDPGPTRTLPLAKAGDAAAAVDPMEDGVPTTTLPHAEVLDEIEVATALGRIDEVKKPVVKKPKKR